MSKGETGQVNVEMVEVGLFFFGGRCTKISRTPVYTASPIGKGSGRNSQRVDQGKEDGCEVRGKMTRKKKRHAES